MLHSWLQFHKRKVIEVVKPRALEDTLRLRGGVSPKGVDLREDLRSIKQQQWHPRKTMGSPKMTRTLPGHRQSIEYAPLFTKPC